MSCFGGHDEQIYLIEILIDKLTLTPGKIKDVAGHPIAIKIRLLDFPVFEFTRDDSDASTRITRDQDVRFAIGKCCLFVMRPRDLVRGLRSASLRVGVFRAGDTYPTAETELTLPGCLCDQLAMIGNEPGEQPKPFAVKGGFHLLDPGENPSGTLHMEVVIARLGRIFGTRHELHPRSFVSGERDEERQVCVRRFVPPEFLEDVDATPPQKEVTSKPKAAKVRKDKKDKKEKKEKKAKAKKKKVKK